MHVKNITINLKVFSSFKKVQLFYLPTNAVCKRTKVEKLNELFYARLIFVLGLADHKRENLKCTKTRKFSCVIKKSCFNFSKGGFR